MGSAAQELKLSTGISKIGGLAKPPAAAQKNLVGADNEGMSMASRHLARLSLCKGERTVGSRLPIGLEDALCRAFVH